MKRNKLEDKLLYSMAHLQEYYESKELLDFFKECENNKVDVCGGFLWIEKEMKESIYGSSKIPKFDELRSKFSKVINGC